MILNVTKKQIQETPKGVNSLSFKAEFSQVNFSNKSNREYRLFSVECAI